MRFRAIAVLSVTMLCIHPAKLEIQPYYTLRAGAVNSCAVRTAGGLGCAEIAPGAEYACRIDDSRGLLCDRLRG
jgi:hypothetical protein